MIEIKCVSDWALETEDGPHGIRSPLCEHNHLSLEDNLGEIEGLEKTVPRPKTKALGSNLNLSGLPRSGSSTFLLGLPWPDVDHPLLLNGQGRPQRER